MKWEKKEIISAIFFVLIMVVSVAIMVLVLKDPTFLFSVIRTYFILPLLEIGFWAIIVFLLLMVLQSIIAPIPSELVLLSGAIIFGFWGGTILGIIGSMVSAVITYYISNKGGRKIIEATGEKLGIVQKMILIVDEWIDKWGVWAIVIGRAVPVIMFDPVSYASGLSNIKWKPYLIATFIGSIPRAIFYAILGTNMLGGNPPSYIKTIPDDEFDRVAGQFNLIFFIILGVLISMLLVANILSMVREKKKKQNQPAQTQASPAGNKNGKSPNTSPANENQDRDPKGK